MRVAIVQEAKSVRITILEPCRALDPKSGKVLREWPHLRWEEARASNPGLEIGGVEFTSQALALEATKGAEIRVNSRAYRGSVILHRTSGGKVTVVNRLNLEEYLVGALGSEANPDWPIEVLKAHAVVSRTMVAHRIWIQKSGSLFDVTADTRTHLYYGVAVERDWVRAAVTATKGQVLAYGGELLSVTFHANCGGHTEDASELWAGKGDLAPLMGRADPYCKDRRHYRWRTPLGKEKLLEALRPEAGGLGSLLSCEVLERNRSGRARTVRIRGSEREVTLTGRRFRELLGPNRLKSLKFTPSVSATAVTFSGFGWGHGVGLCQWGAYGMARKGKKMDEILSFYFPVARVRALKGLPGYN